MSPSRPAPADAAPHPRVAGQIPLGPYRWLLICLAVVFPLIAWQDMAGISQGDPWYDNADVNLHNVVDALAINSNISPARVDQPGLPGKFLLALDYRIRHFTGFLPVWNLRKFGNSRDPLRELTVLVRIGRAHSRILVMLFLLTAAGTVYAVTRSPETALCALILLCASAGLLFQGLVNRPELLCSWFGTVLLPFCLWRFAASDGGHARPAWLFAAGMAAGLGILAKEPALYFLPASIAWCWVVASTTQEVSGTAPERSRLGPVLLPLVTSAAFFSLMRSLVAAPDAMTAVATFRLYIVAGLVAALPLAAAYRGRNRLGGFFVQRSLELAWIGGGALAAILLAYAALRTVMTQLPALTCLARVLDFVAHPDPLVKYFLSSTPHPGGEFLRFVRESPLLFLGATAVAVAVVLRRAIPARFKALIGLLWLNALVLPAILAHSYFQEPFSVFAQVPLGLVVVLGLFELGVWRAAAPSQAGHWAVPLLLAATTVLVLTVNLRLEAKQRVYRTETDSPVSNLTLTFLYDHDAHPERYRQVMREHYGTREQFSTTLQQYLADPAHRY